MKRLLLPICAFALGFSIAGFHALSVRTQPPPTATPNLTKATQLSAPERNDGLASAIAAVQSIGFRPSLRNFAELGELLDQLDSTKVASLLDFLEKEPQHTYRDLECAFSWWLRRDPAAASAWIQPRLKRFAQDGPLGMSFDSSGGYIVSAWVKALPKEALEFAREHARTGLAAELLERIHRSHPERDPSKLHAIALAFPESAARTLALRKSLEYWAAKDGAGALAAAQSLDGQDRTNGITTVLENWPQKDARAAFDSYRSLGLSDPELLAKILRKAGTADPRKAIEWLGELDETQIARAAPEIVDAWAAKEPVAALQWALEHGIPLSGRSSDFRMKTHHNGLGRQGTSDGGRTILPIQSAMKKDADATLAWIRSLPDPADRQRLTELAILSANPQQKLSLFADLPPEAQQRWASNVAINLGADGRRWAESLPSGPARENAWRGLGTSPQQPIDLPPGPDRDAMLQGRSLPTGERKPAQSLDLILQISDPIRRRDAFDDAMEFYVETLGEHMAAETREALEKADFPEDWKRPWRTSRALATPR